MTLSETQKKARYLLDRYDPSDEVNFYNVLSREAAIEAETGIECDLDLVSEVGAMLQDFDVARFGEWFTEWAKHAERPIVKIFDFEPLAPLDDMPEMKLPPFPVEDLPDEVRPFVENVADVLEVPAAIPACQILAVFASICQSRWTIRLSDSWENHLNLYLFTIADPGELKSASFKECRAPLDWCVREENSKRADDIRRGKAEIKIAAASLSRLEKALGQKNGASISSDDLANRQRELEEAEANAVKPVQLLVDDTTPEALGMIMKENGGEAAVLTPEGGFVDILLGRYDKNGAPNIDLINKAYDGETYTCQRVGRGALKIEEPLLTCGFFVQPDVLSSVFASDTMRGRGFVSRFLYCKPRTKVGSRTLENKPFDKDAKSKYWKSVVKLFDVKGESEEIRLSAEAFMVLQSFRLEIERQIGPDGKLAPLKDIASRIPGNTGRIMGICHAISYGRAASEVPVSREEAERAVRVGRYFLEHITGIYFSPMGEDAKVLQDARYVFRRIKEYLRDNGDNGDNEPLTVRKIQRLCRDRTMTREVLDAALEGLEERGYLKKINKKGVRGQDVIVNPAALEL